MHFRLVPKSSTLDDLELLYAEFSRNFASIRCRVLYYDSAGGACRALTFALARLSCIDLLIPCKLMFLTARVHKQSFYHSRFVL